MSVTDKNIRIFFLEDNTDDVELELHELQKTGYTVEYEIARNLKEFLEKIPHFNADLILADYSLPDITGIEAITICRDLGIDIPVMLITGEGNELIAVDSLRLGAVDYVLKRNIAGLPARIQRTLEIWNDRKAKRRAEAEEKRLQELLFETQKMEAIGRLAGGIAHDFNNILTGILGFADLCLEKVSHDSDLSKRINSIITLSHRGSDLVRQLLVFSSKTPLEFRRVNLNSFILEVVQFLKRMVEETVEIRLDLTEDVPHIECDIQQFTQILLNLTLNARDAMGAGGTITIKTERCLLPDDLVSFKSGSADRGCVCLSFADTGAGISDEDIAKIFDPFYTTKGADKGTGLGLSIVYSVVNSHGGYIRVNSGKGKGAEFIIYLPCLNVECQEGVVESSPRGSKDDLKDLCGDETVLIAEDEDVLRELEAIALRSFGYSVKLARDGTEALDIYRNFQKGIDLVVSDMLMPRMGGVELFRELKSLNSEIKFVLVTGYSLDDQHRETLEAMDAVMKKPYTPVELVRLMRDVLDATTK
jgi:signal transduction histidine kinase